MAEGLGVRVRVRDHLDKYLAVYVAVAIVAGLLGGLRAAPWVQAHSSLMNMAMMASIYLMIFPMMLMLRMGGLAKAFRSWKMVALVLLMNFAWGPLMAVALGYLFIPAADWPLRLGLFLAWLVPCSSMSVGYVGLMRGNIEAATALVALTFILAIPLIPIMGAYLPPAFGILASSSAAAAGSGSILSNLTMTIIEIIVVPLVLGIAIHEGYVRRAAERLGGKEKAEGHWFTHEGPIFSSITILGMFVIVFFIFFGHAALVVSHVGPLLGVFYSAMTFGTISLLLFTWLTRRVRLDYWDSMAVLFPGIGKNEATAIAIATVAFSPLVAIPAATLPIFQIVFLVAYIKLRPRIAHYFGIKAADVQFKHEMAAGSGAGGGE